MRQQQQRLLDTDSSAASLESFGRGVEGIRPLEEENDGKSLELADKVETAPAECRPCEANQEMGMNEKPIVKRPFLKKGSGLARFKLQNKPILKECKKPQPKQQTKVTFAEDGGYVDPMKKPPVLDKPTAKLDWNKPDTQINSFNCEVISKINQYAMEKETKPAINSTENSYAVQPNSTSEKELLIFEALERKTVNSSFCSTNSSIVRLLSSTPQSENSKQKMQQNFGSVSDVTDDSELIDRLIGEHLTGNNVEAFIRNLQLLRQKNEDMLERSCSSVTSEDIEETTVGGAFHDSDSWSDCSGKGTEVDLESDCRRKYVSLK